MREVGQKPSFVVGVTLALLAVGGCVREYTYPPDFRYLSAQEIQTSMGAMVQAVTEINRLIEDGIRTPDQRQALVRQLEALQLASVELDGSRPTNHPVINANIAAFRRHIDTALAGARADPPNYFYAGSVAGSCMYCHRHARTGARP